ncbi:IS110 family transposase [Shewanella sp. AS16]|uniref:IS110 family transposase n=1 Tax=Shewanella sp. AS16 TaxID=2907625 RepID=UPI001F19CF6B|nr:IS110 family transposase [Shewanella sp. AS16]MCE9687753.1 IS110 family transposase [Shewanella sp. AS16]
MSKANTLFIGLDVHKETTDVALVSDKLTDAVQYYGTLPTNLRSFDKLIKNQTAKASKLCVVYEAGPCGFWLYRHLQRRGIACWVIAPALIPKAPGDRVKTDKRDSMTLARLARSGDLKPIYVPDERDEAIRDLIRCREDAMLDLRQARQRLKSFLLRHGHPCSGRQNWTEAYRRHLADISFQESATKLTFQHYVNIVTERHERLQRLELELQSLAESWRWYPLVQRLTVLRGIRFLSAMTIMAELGDLRRFDSPRSLMNFVGLTPSERSSGQRERRGGITKCGNGHVRRILIESAWAYRFPAKVSRELESRQQGHSIRLQTRAWEVQQRLCRRFHALKARGKEYNKVVTTVARELTGYLWDIAREFEVDMPITAY